MKEKKSPYLKRHTFAGRAGQSGEALDGAAGDERLEAAVDLGHRLLDKWHLQLVPLGLAVQQSPLLVAGQEIVQEDGRPAAVLAQPDLVRPDLVKVPGDDDLPDEVLSLRQDCEGRKQPAVAQNA